jgi:hypothetical protein
MLLSLPVELGYCRARAAAAVARRRLGGGWAAAGGCWAGWAAVSKQRRVVALRIATRRRVKQLQAWRALAAAGKTTRVAVTRLLRKRLQQGIATAFYAWADTVAEQKVEREKAALAAALEAERAAAQLKGAEAAARDLGDGASKGAEGPRRAGDAIHGLGEAAGKAERLKSVMKVRGTGK